MKMFSASTILVLLAATTSSSNAFSFGSSTQKKIQSTSLQYSTLHNNVAVVGRSMMFELKMSAEEPEAEEAAKEAEVVEEKEGEAAKEAEVVEEEEEKEEEEEEEDPELVAIKEEIKKLESTLKFKKNKIQEVQDEAEEYTKGGYARKVAQMENMRRRRSMMQSSDKSAASANVVAEFLPVLDELVNLNEKYESNEFGKQYSGLLGALESSFSRLGVTEYEAAEGEKVDYSKTEVIESVHSDDIEKGIVIEKVTNGLELQGNVIRMSKAVVSLGPEKKEEEATEEATPSAEEDAAPKEEETKEE